VSGLRTPAPTGGAVAQARLASRYATGGDGTAGTPYTFAGNDLPTATNTVWHFDAGTDNLHGHYTLNLDLRDKPYVSLVGAPGVVIHAVTGATTIIRQDSANHCPGLFVRDLTLDGGGQANVSAIYLRAAHRIRLDGITVQNLGASSHGIYAEFCICARVTRYKQSNWPPASLGNVGIPSGLPAGTQGIRLLATSVPLPNALTDAGPAPCTQWTITAPVIEGCTGAGLNFENVWYSQVIGGTSEANGTGLLLAANARDCTIINLDCEGNTAADWTVGGQDNALRGCAGTNGTATVTGTNNLLDGGWWGTITTAGSVRAILRNLHYGANAGTLTYLADTVLDGLINDAGTPLALRGSAQLGGDYTVTHVDGTWEATGLTVSLPGPGTYRIRWDAFGGMQRSGGFDSRLYGRLFNVTAAAVVANSAQEIAFETFNSYVEGAAGREALVTVTAASTIRLEAAGYINTPGTWLFGPLVYASRTLGGVANNTTGITWQRVNQ
jgi:hypothetical protein